VVTSSARRCTPRVLPAPPVPWGQAAPARIRDSVLRSALSHPHSPHSQLCPFSLFRLRSHLCPFSLFSPLGPSSSFSPRSHLRPFSPRSPSSSFSPRSHLCPFSPRSPSSSFSPRSPSLRRSRLRPSLSSASSLRGRRPPAPLSPSFSLSGLRSLFPSDYRAACSTDLLTFSDNGYIKVLSQYLHTVMSDYLVQKRVNFGAKKSKFWCKKSRVNMDRRKITSRA
jgi:hypothetical protein